MVYVLRSGGGVFRYIMARGIMKIGRYPLDCKAEGDGIRREKPGRDRV
jgi:hypothetical protein